MILIVNIITMICGLPILCGKLATSLFTMHKDTKYSILANTFLSMQALEVITLQLHFTCVVVVLETPKESLNILNCEEVKASLVKIVTSQNYIGDVLNLSFII